MIKNKNYHDLRQDYRNQHLEVSDLNPNPFTQFDQWFKNAINENIMDANAMCLATMDSNQNIFQRNVLLKEVHSDGFVFYTNYNSAKAKQLTVNPKVSVNFFWREQARQITISGIVEKVSKDQSENYFKNRPRESQLAAWASIQSEPLSSREEIESRYEKLEIKYQDQDIPLPEFWGGYLIKATRFEFWQGSAMRLHDRFIYQKIDHNWEITRLNP